ncbi:MAG: endopeptidase La [Pseudomonadota bacterium]
MLDLPKSLPLLCLKDMVLFPGLISPLFISRPRSLNALSAAREIGDGQYVLFTSQKSHTIDDPKLQDLYKVGVLAKIMQTVKLPDNSVKLLVEILHRTKIQDIKTKGEYISAEYEILQDDIIEDLEHLELVLAEAVEKFGAYIKLNKKVNPEIFQVISQQKNPSYIANIISSHLTCSIKQKQELLEMTNVHERAEHLSNLISSEMLIMNTEVTVQHKVKQRIDKNQRDYYLNEQMKVIQQELNTQDDKSDLLEMEKKIKSIKLTKEAKEKAESELKKLRSMGPMSAEASVVRNYLDTLLSMPWGKSDKPTLDIKNAKKILDRDHYGLEKIKERIIEYLAVLQRSRKLNGPILCLVGPPGVGKTSLAKSIAEALGRKYTKFALGGVRDESEIRGHRRTYLGAMPGKIISIIKKAKTNNPVMLLDEIDKMSSDFRGDPASALLEALDPEQNKAFVDHYLDVEYDLSDVMFVATANTLDLPRPLLDRMEIIRLSGYVEEEKLQIARNYLVPKQLKDHNLKESELTIPDETIMEVIRYYTRESGVRNLEREIGALCRKVLKKILDDKSIKSIAVEPKDLESYLGVKKYHFGLAEEEDQVGAATGLAYTEVGGELLTIEAVCVPGKGDIKATGKLGDVMKESTQAAYSYFQSQAEQFGLKNSDYKEIDVHIHVPEGATPKDGPSAGIAIFTTLVSLMTGSPVKKSVAMTGEITLRGRVLGIGGLKEKLLAARRGGIKTVIIPEENKKDLQDIPDSIKSHLTIIPVKHASEVLEIALARPSQDG